MGNGVTKPTTAESAEGLDTVDRPALKRGDSIGFVANDAADRAIDIADRIDTIVAPDLEANARYLAIQNRQKVQTAVSGFGSSTTVIKKKVETIGPKAGPPRREPRKKEEKVLARAPSGDAQPQDKFLSNVFGMQWATLPLWRKAVERAKLKARLSIAVARAFQENAEIHPSKDYLQQLIAEMYDMLGVDKAKYMDLQFKLIAAGGAPDPKAKAKKTHLMNVLDETDPHYVKPTVERDLFLPSVDIKPDGELTAEPTEPADIYGYMQAILNRSNAKALRQRPWGVPVGSKLLEWMSRDAREVAFFLEKAVAALRGGELVVAISFAGTGLDVEQGEENSQRPPIYMLDPWEAAQTFSAAENLEFGLGSGYAHIEGLPLGARALFRLTSAITKWGGKVALAHVPVIIHCNTDELSSVIIDLKERKFYGLSRENIYIVPEPPMPAFRFDAETKTLTPDERATPQNYGTGYRLRQLSWPRETIRITEDGSQELLECPLLEQLVTDGVKFMTWGPLDFHRLTDDGALDLEFLAYSMKLMDDTAGNMAVEVKQGPVSEARVCGSVVMRDTSRKSTKQDVMFVTELRMDGFTSSQSAKVYDAVSAQMISNTVQGPPVPTSYNSTHRYTFFVPDLQTILTKEYRWEMPMLSVQRNGTLRPLLCMEDVTAAPGAKCVAIATKNMTDRLKHKSDIPNLIHIVGEMDRDVKFQEHVAGFSSEQKPLMLRSEGEMVRYRVCVTALFDAPSKRAFQSIPQLLRPGVDKLEMLNLVRYLSEVPSAHQMLTTFELKGPSQFLEMNREVRVLAPKQKIVEGIRDHTDIKHPNLLVVGSDVTELGSNALAIAKEVLCPMLIVKQRLDETAPIKWMVAIDHSSIPALKFTCSLMRAQDKLYLCRAAAKEEGLGPASQQQRILNVFKDLALAEGVRATQLPMLGKTLEVLPKACQLNKIDVLVMQVAKLRTYTDTVKKITVAAQASVLLFKFDAKDRDQVKLGSGGIPEPSFRTPHASSEYQPK